MPLLHAPTDRPRPGNLLVDSLGIHPRQAEELLEELDLGGTFQRHGVRFGRTPEAVYGPELTLWAMTSQFFFAEQLRSCQAAVSRVITLYGLKHERTLSANTAAFCRARKKLQAATVAELARRAAHAAERRAARGVGAQSVALPEPGRGDLAFLLHRLLVWAKGRRIVLFDGFMVHAADTKANQQRWPQSGSQEEGLGFPVLRGAVLTSLLTGSVIDARFGPGKGKATGETALLREMLGHLGPGDVLVADSYHCSYWFLAECVQRGIEVVAKNNATRDEDPAHTQVVKGDPSQRIVTLQRPAKRADWMTREEFLAFPVELEVSLVDVVAAEVDRPGRFTVATTLVDAEAGSADWIRDLYRSRWLVELDIRAIKDTMGINRLRSKSPAMVETELWCGLLAYNLIRLKIQVAVEPQPETESELQVMPAGEAKASGTAPRAARTCGFTKAMGLVAAQWVPLAVFGPTPAMVEASRVGVLRGRVGHRPGRVEPRAVKWRPKVLALLMIARPLWRKQQEQRDAA